MLIADVTAVKVISENADENVYEHKQKVPMYRQQLNADVINVYSNEDMFTVYSILG